jgi:hypothetical protein
MRRQHLLLYTPEAMFLRMLAVLQAANPEPCLGAEHDPAVAAQTLLTQVP